MSYCGTYDVKWFTRITYDQLGFASDAEYGNWISGTLIPKAKDLIDSYVGHDFEITGGTIILDGSGKENYISIEGDLSIQSLLLVLLMDLDPPTCYRCH